MSIIYVLIPIAILLTILGVYFFFWAVKTEQFQDLEKQGLSILFDDDSVDGSKSNIKNNIKNNNENTPLPSVNNNKEINTKVNTESNTPKNTANKDNE